MDGLRALAAIVVFFFHLTWRAPWLYDHVRAATGHFDVGVEIFFVLTGFLIWKPFAKSLVEGDALPRTATYAAKRAIRVWPAYLVALGGVIVTGVAELDGISGFLKHATLTYLYFEDRGGAAVKVAWTLVVQVSFYAFAPLLAQGLRASGLGRRRLAVPLVLTVLGGVCQVLAINGTLSWPPSRVLPPPMVSIGIGMLFAGVIVRPTATAESTVDRIVRTAASHFTGCWLAAAATMAVLSVLVPDMSPDYPRDSGGYVIQTFLQVLAATWFVLPTVFPPVGEGSLQRILRTRTVVWLGTMSFGFYLWHIPVLRWLREWVADDRLAVASAAWTAAVAIALALAALSDRFVERPAARWVDRRLRARP